MGKKLFKKVKNALIGVLSALAEFGKGASYALRH